MKKLLLIALAILTVLLSSSSQKTLYCDHSNFLDFIFDSARTSDLIRQTGQGCRLRGIDLSGQQFTKIDLRKADLRDAVLKDARFWQSRFEGADIRWANFENSQLWMSNFRGVRADDANFKWADLGRVDLTLAILNHADLRWAQAQVANFYRAQFWETRLEWMIVRPEVIEQLDRPNAELRWSDLHGAYLGWVEMQTGLGKVEWANLEEMVENYRHGHGTSKLKPRSLPWMERSKMLKDYCQANVLRLLMGES